jgi:Heavy metal associated domain 2
MLFELATRYLLSALVEEVVGRSIEAVARRTLDSCIRPNGHRSRPSVATVVSDIPGRVRFRVDALRDDAARAAAMVRSLQGQPGVCAVCANPVTGTVLVHYDPNQVTLALLQSMLEGRSRRVSAGRNRRLSARRATRLGRIVIARRMPPRSLVADRQPVRREPISA